MSDFFLRMVVSSTKEPRARKKLPDNLSLLKDVVDALFKAATLQKETLMEPISTFK